MMVALGFTSLPKYMHTDPSARAIFICGYLNSVKKFKMKNKNCKRYKKFFLILKGDFFVKLIKIFY